MELTTKDWQAQLAQVRSEVLAVHDESGSSQTEEEEGTRSSSCVGLWWN